MLSTSGFASTLPLPLVPWEEVESGPVIVHHSLWSMISVLPRFSFGESKYLILLVGVSSIVSCCNERSLVFLLACLFGMLESPPPPPSSHKHTFLTTNCLHLSPDCLWWNSPGHSMLHSYSLWAGSSPPDMLNCSPRLVPVRLSICLWNTSPLEATLHPPRTFYPIFFPWRTWYL